MFSEKNNTIKTVTAYNNYQHCTRDTCENNVLEIERNYQSCTKNGTYYLRHKEIVFL